MATFDAKTNFKSSHVQLTLSSTQLFGRETEQEILWDAYQDAIATTTTATTTTTTSNASTCTESLQQPKGTKALVVSGYSGVGKTRLIRQTFSTVDSYLGGGKYEQYASSRQRPWPGLLDACTDLLSQVVKAHSRKTTESSWHSFLTNKEDKRQQEEEKAELEFLASFVPLLATLLGDKTQKGSSMQESPLTTSETIAPEEEETFRRETLHTNFWATRIKSAIRLLINRISGWSSLPVILFLDDLQWADGASLDLIQGLVSDCWTGTCQALFVLSYRSNEVADTIHPLSIMFRQLEQTHGSPVWTKLEIQDLSLDALNQWMACMMERNADDTMSLTNVIYQKTKGNAFFSLQLLKSLVKDALVYYSLKSYRWEFETDNIRSQAKLSENVVEVVITALRRLPEEVQRMLQVSSCLGSRFQIHHVVSILNVDESSLDNMLDQAVQENLIVATEETGTFCFTHDRIQQGAYSLLEDGPLRANLHLRIGRSLLPESALESALKSKIWKHVNEKVLLTALDQLNRGSSQMNEPLERVELAHMNGHAGKIFIRRNAFVLAVHYLETAGDLLNGQGGWNDHESVMRTIHSDLAEMLVCVGRFQQAIDLCQVLLGKTNNVRAYKVIPHTLIVQSFARLHQIDEMFNHAVIALRDLNQPIPANPRAFRVLWEFLSTDRALRKYSESQLSSIPLAKEPEGHGIQIILVELLTVSMTIKSKQMLMPVIACRQVQTLLKYGFTSKSPSALSVFGSMVATIRHDIQRAFYLGETSLKLAKFHSHEMKSSNAIAAAVALCTHLQKPYHEARELALRGYREAIEMADILAASGCSSSYVALYFMSGLTLPPLYDDILSFLSVAQDYSHNMSIYSLAPFLPALCGLLGRPVPRQLAHLVQLACQDKVYGKQMHDMKMSRDMVAACFLGQVDFLMKQEQVLWKTQGEIQIVLNEKCLFDCFMGMVELLVFEQNGKRRHKVRATKMVRKLKWWVRNVNVNGHAMLLLLQAEYARVITPDQDIKSLFDRAIVVASREGFLNFAALANEKMGQHYYYTSKKSNEWAEDYLTQALMLYHEWGAQAKVNEMLQQHEFLRVVDLPLTRGGNLRGRPRFESFWAHSQNNGVNGN